MAHSHPRSSIPSTARAKTGAAEVFRTLAPFDFAKAGSGKGLKVEDLELSEEEMDMYVDLHPITNRSPYTVVENMSLAKAAVLFRGLALRHMCVVPMTQGVSDPSASRHLFFSFLFFCLPRRDRSCMPTLCLCRGRRWWGS